MEKDIQKSYSNGEIRVTWRPSLCIHSGNCARNLSAVFRPAQRPWINMEGAGSAEIKATVAKCPSGALGVIEEK
jgi:uncharacterized Fe-S cluster protein YjdI